MFLVGGGNTNGPSQEIIQLFCQDDIVENCKWQKYEQKSQILRAGHLVIPLPESHDICK